MAFLDDLFSLQGRVALVTGASSGIGRAMAAARSQAEAWSHRGVCCNVVVPGFVHTPMTEAVFSDPDRVTALAARTMAGRNGSVDDFRGVVIFLAGAASAYVTGQAICVDGGFSSC